MKQKVKNIVFTCMTFFVLPVIGMEQRGLPLQCFTETDDIICAFSQFAERLKVQNFDNDENSCKNVVTAVVNIMKEPGAIGEHFVAKQLAHYIPEYTLLKERIEKAFKPESNEQDAWYINAVMRIEARSPLHKELEFRGGWFTPLGLAVRTANPEWCRQLIARGAEVNKKCYDECARSTTHLYEVVMYNDINKKRELYHTILCLLLESGAFVDVGINFRSSNYSPLKLAISTKDEDSVRALHNNGARLIDEQWLLQDNLMWYAVLLQEIIKDMNNG